MGILERAIVRSLYNIGSHYVFIEVVALDRIRGLYFTITELTTYFLWREHKEGVESPGKGPEIVKVNLDEIQMISTALTWYCKDKKAISIHLVGEVDQIHPLEDNCRREQIWHLMIFFSTNFPWELYFSAHQPLRPGRWRSSRRSYICPLMSRVRVLRKMSANSSFSLELENYNKTSLDMDEMFLMNG